MDWGKASSRVFAANLFNSVIGFLGIAYFARVLGADTLGAFFLFKAVVGISSLFSDAGIKRGIEKRLSEERERGKHLAAGLFMKTILFLLVAIIMVVFMNYINGYIGENVTIWVIFGILFRELDKTGMHILQGEFRVGETAFLKSIRQVIWISVGSGALIVTNSVFSVIFSQLLANFAVGVWSFAKSDIKVAIPNQSHFYSIYSYSKYEIVSAAGGEIYNWSDVAILGYFVSPHLVSYYELAWRVSTVVTLLSRAVATSVFPLFSSLHHTGENSQIIKESKKSIFLSIFLVIPSFFGSIMLGEDIMGLLFGTEYRAAAFILTILMFEKVIRSAYIIIRNIIQAIDKPRIIAKIMLLTVVINITLNIILTYQIGVLGAALATTISFAMNLIFAIRALRDYLKLEFPLYEFGWSVLSSTIMLSYIYMVKTITPFKGDLITILTIITSAIIYISVIFLSKDARSIVVEFITESVS